MIISKEDSFYFNGEWGRANKFFMSYHYSDNYRYPQVGEYIPGVGRLQIVKINNIIFIKDEN